MKKVEELKQQSKQNQVKLKGLEKMAAKNERISKKLEAKLIVRQKLCDIFVETKEKILADLEEWNRNAEVSLFQFAILFKNTIFITQFQGLLKRSSSCRTSIDSSDTVHETVQEQEVEPIPVVDDASVEPINVANTEPKQFKKMVLPNLNLDDIVFPTSTKQALYINPVKQHVCIMDNNMSAPNRSPHIWIPNERVRFDQERI